MKENLQKNIFLFKEHLGMFKASNNYDVYDPKTKEIILHCREKNLNPVYKIVRMFLTDFKRMTPFEIDIRGLNGKRIIKVKKGLSLILSKIEVFDENDKLNLVSHDYFEDESYHLAHISLLALQKYNLLRTVFYRIHII